MLGLAFALKQEGALDGLCGRMKLCLVPAEEGIEIGYRKELIKKGIIKYTTGKPEFISRGYFDDLDVYNYNDKWLSSSTDMGDVSVLFPSIHFYANGSSGTEHGIDYKIIDAYNTCVNSAKIEYKLLRNLLSNNAKKAKYIIEKFKPAFSSVKEYLQHKNSLEKDKETTVYNQDGTITIDYK